MNNKWGKVKKTKYQCLFLCRLVYIAIIPPNDPNKNDIKSRVFSLVLHLPFIAFLLSKL